MVEIRIKKVWVDRKVEACGLTRRLLDKLRGLPVETVDSPEPVKEAIRLSPDPVGESKQNLYITEQKSFIRPCPCTPGCLGCGYWTIDLDLNCPFDCSYCILQKYLYCQPLTVAVNRDRVRQELMEFIQKRPGGIIRIGSGELADSLALDGLTGNSLFLMDIFRGQGRIWLELKTKSDRVTSLLEVSPAGNVVPAWSLNPEPVIASEEKGTASLRDRLEAAAAAVKHGYRVGFHFDPIIHYPGWKEDYQALVERIFRQIPPEAIVWISLGSLRFSPGLPSVARSRFPESYLYEHEFIRSWEGKYRYPRPLRLGLYQELAAMLAEFRAEDKLYLCMESVGVWHEFRAKIKRGRQNLTFPFSWLD